MTSAIAPVHTIPAQLFDRHRETLDSALAAIASREYFSAYSESPKAYGDDAPAAGAAAFKGRLGSQFELDQPSTGSWVGEERSPYGFDLGIAYPEADIDAVLN